MNRAQLNEMNSALIRAIRKISPTRQLHLGGLAHMHASWILANPNAIHFPPVRDSEGLISSIHSLPETLNSKL